MSTNVGFFCKSYRGDFIPLRQLLETFHAHNPEDLQLTLSLPDNDRVLFESAFSESRRNVRIVADESYCGEDLSRFPGWHAQQICKLMSWRVMEADHYAVLDSDCYLIRDIRRADLEPTLIYKNVACASYLRTVLKPENSNLVRYLRDELTIGPELFPAEPTDIVDRLSDFVHLKDLPQDNPGAVERSDVPMKTFGRKRWLYSQPGQIFSAALLRDLLSFFGRHNLTAGDAISISPWEYNWYGEFAATHAYRDTEFRISPFLHFQEKKDLEFARQQKFTEETLQKKFWVIQMAARHLAEPRFEDLLGAD